MEAELLLDAKSELGEGPSWDGENGVLYWVDIFRGLVHRYDPEESRDEAFQAGQYVSSVVPCRSGGVAVTLQHGFYTLNLGGKPSLIAEAERELAGNRFNDGKCDPSGRFWAGTMDIEEKRPTGALYVLEGRGRVRNVLENVTVSNGLGWSPDHLTLYYIDSPTKIVSAFDYSDSTGEIANGRTAVNMSDQPGYPDGMAVDAEGMLWVAHWGGGRVTRFDPRTGKALEYVNVPASQVTSCCFGGRRLDQLYVTSAKAGIGADEAAKGTPAGGLFRVETGVRGLETFTFRD